MINRNVLVVAYYFPPMGLSGVQRTFKFVKYLPDFGWNPIVLTTSPSSYYAFDERLLDEYDGKDIQIHRTQLLKPKKDKPRVVKFPSYFKQKFGRYFIHWFYQPDRIIRWKKHALALGEEIIRKNDISVILATAPPFTDFLVGYELSKKFYIPFIVDYRDVWIDNPFHVFPTPMHKQHCINLEKEILTYTGKVIVTARHIKELLIKRYKFISHDDITIVSHGWDPDDFKPYQDVKPDQRKFTITHTGLFQDNRTPYYFLKALSNIIKKEPELSKVIEARFVGLMRPKHLKYIKRFKLQNNVVCIDYCTHSESVKHLLESDVLWLMLKDTVRSPGKLYEYFGARKPLLVCSPDGTVRRTAIESKAAITTNPKDTKAIEKAIKTLITQWKSNDLPVPSEEFIQQFNRKELTASLARELALASEI